MSTGATPTGYFMFGCPSSPSTQIDWCGEVVQPRRLAYGRSSTEIDFVVPEASDHVAVLVPNDLLLQYLSEESAAALLRDPHHLACDPRLSGKLIAMLHLLLDKFLAQDELLSDERVCKAIESELLETLATVLPSGNTQAGGQFPRQRRSALRRAIEYAEDLHQPIKVPELAVAAEVSQRVLELAFKETLGTTPLRYLRWNRMNRVQRDLLTAQAGTTSVKETALQWGFLQLGRFAVDYKQLFGESPSTTLARIPRPQPKRLADTLIERSSR